MSQTNFVFAGAVAPDAVVIEIAPSTTVPDLSVVTAAYIDVVAPSGTISTWAVAITSQSPTLLVLRHVFDALGLEVAGAGSYLLTPRLSTPSGERRAVSVRLSVRSLNG